jgi:AcrR family transcriptional regulator
VAYEVTKRIKGRDYRYRVESYRDPQTNRRKARWKYVGVVRDGKVRQPIARTPRRRTSREELLAATMRLLEFRDPKFVTVDVIARTAGASHSTFYRYFSNQREVIGEALAQLCDEAIRSLPTLDGEAQSLHEARVQLRRWCEAYHRSIGQQRALQRALAQGYSGKLRARLECSMIKEDPAARLAAFFERLNTLDFAAIDDPAGLACAVNAVNRALRMAETLKPPGHEIPVPEFEEIYPVIERAVFGASIAAESVHSA